MEPESLRQLRGGVELAASAVEAAVNAIAETHQAIVQQVYAPLALPGPLGDSVHAIGQIQTTITSLVYQTILGTSRIAALGALTLLERQPWNNDQTPLTPPAS